MKPLAHSRFSSWQSFLEPPATGQRHVSDSSMSIADMAFHQKRSAEADIRELIWQCRERYCFAHRLIRPHAALPDGLSWSMAPDLSPFCLPWSELCSAWRSAFFDPQLSLLEDQRSREFKRWQVFVEQECYARFTRDPDWIRCALETANLLPIRRSDRITFVGHMFEDLIQDVIERNDHDACPHD